ncbi:hypothetical protein MNQ98_09030 [Paenibacillus sp. N3/727]|uniref:hypothetical protein n=1 Tax=Paenibacillus sp. N3/727 TaxID=2925845 RepID=UPI001F538C3A|nr:hypothetical protein [Paenibacillus sp. N3/727]UNK20137.1 hypothetical protein MNQ98_09030 [Paenibacillus sp. N3/727]
MFTILLGVPLFALSLYVIKNPDSYWVIIISSTLLTVYPTIPFVCKQQKTLATQGFS